MSRSRTIAFVLLSAFAVSALAAAVRFELPVSEPPLHQAQTVQSKIALDSVMMARNAQNVPVFGFPTTIFQPFDHEANTHHLLDVDAVYREFQTPQMGTIQASPVSVCSTRLTGKRAPVAMARLAVRSPCNPDTSFVIRHEGIAFTVRTDENGIAEFDVPALSMRARFAVYENNVEQDAVEVIVPEARAYERVAVHWKTDEKVHLHAFEADAFIGGVGHVWSAAPNQIEDVLQRVGGHLQTFGEPGADIPYMTEIYTFPVEMRAKAGEVSLRLSNLLNPQNCGREVDLTVVEAYGSGSPVVTAISPKMPACDQIGFVVLLAKDLPTLLSEAD